MQHLILITVTNNFRNYFLEGVFQYKNAFLILQKYGNKMFINRFLTQN